MSRQLTRQITEVALQAPVKKRKIGPLIRFLACIRILSLLAEDIFVILKGSDEIGVFTIFWVMYGFSVGSGVVDSLGLFSFYIEFLGGVCLEITQAILFMWACEFQYFQVIVLGSISALQLLCQCIELGYNHANKEKDDTEVEGIIVTIQICLKCYMPTFIGIGVLPYLYYHEGSFCRQQWFEICSAISFWLSTVQNNVQGQILGNITADSTGSLPWYFYPLLAVNYLWGIGFMIVIYVYSILFIQNKEWQNDFEKGYTIFIIASLSCSLCSFCYYCLQCTSKLGESA
jgi:hypothetical protein